MHDRIASFVVQFQKAFEGLNFKEKMIRNSTISPNFGFKMPNAANVADSMTDGLNSMAEDPALIDVARDMVSFTPDDSGKKVIVTFSPFSGFDAVKVPLPMNKFFAEQAAKRIYNEEKALLTESEKAISADVALIKPLGETIKKEKSAFPTVKKRFELFG